MKIKELKLTNFRPFHYDTTINFDFSETKPLTIVRAENRTGKTSLLTAIQWCLYGDKVIIDSKQSLTGGDLLVSLDALENAKPDDIIQTQVSVRFEYGGKEFIAKRVRETRRAKHAVDSLPDGTDVFTVLRVDPTGVNIVPNPTIFIQQILPENLRELFFFDGDRINSFMKPDHQDAVQAAVSDMLEFELFDEALRHLKSIITDYRSQLQAIATGEAKILREKQSKLSKDIDQVKDVITGLEKEIASAEILQETLTNEIASEPGDAGRLQQQINSLKNQIQNLEKSGITLGVELGRQMGQGIYFTMTENLEKARTLLLKKKEAGEIPKRIGEELIRERLDLEVCICNRSLKSGDPARKYLEEELIKQKDRGIFDELATEVLFHLSSFSRRNKKELSDQLNDILNQRENQRQTVIALSKQIMELEKQLGDIDVEAIERKRNALIELRKRIQSLVVSREEKKHKLESLGNELKEIERRLQQAEKLDKKNRALRLREKIADDCIKALTLTYHNVREIEREKISKNTEKNFFEMNLRKDEFEKVEVTPSFRLQVIAPGGHIANPILSGAQRRALSLSFLFALMQVSERDAVVVVDTPLGMTSGSMRRSITQTMINQTEQLILLLTRAEIEGVEDILKNGEAGHFTLTNSQDYPVELVNPPKNKGKYTAVCSCGIDQHCTLCERIPDNKVTQSKK